jgi:hypothetical protein
LIKGCAFAGLGNFYFIHNDAEIETKVIQSLSKTHLEYLLIQEASLLNQNGEVISKMEETPFALCPGV